MTLVVLSLGKNWRQSGEQLVCHWAEFYRGCSGTGPALIVYLM